MKIFNLPDLGEGLPSAEIHQWHVKEGDEVKTNQILVSVETAKALVDIPSPRAGKITKLYGKQGEVIETGHALLEFEKEDDKGTVVGHIEVGQTISTEPPQGVGIKTSKTSAVKALPATRALAKKLNIDLSTVTPTGLDGQILTEDIERVAQQNLTPPEGYTPLHGTRRTMATTLSKSHAEIVPVTLFDDADISSWEENTDVTVRVISAIVHTCQTQPALNAWYNTPHISIKLFTEVHIGLAIDTEEGLFVATLKNAETKTPDALRAEIDRLKERVKKRTITPEEMQGYTFILTNFGVFAGRYATPVIVPPCVAILGMGKIRDKQLPLSLSFDHRAVTGGEASRFLGALLKNI